MHWTDNRLEEEEEEAKHKKLRKKITEKGAKGRATGKVGGSVSVRCKGHRISLLSVLINKSTSCERASVGLNMCTVSNNKPL